jgi:hypothetical protein
MDEADDGASRRKKQPRRRSDITKAKDAARKKAWREKNREHLRERDRLWRQENAEQKRANDRAYGQANRERIAKRNAARYADLKDERRPKAAEWYRKNKDQVKRRVKESALKRRLENPEIVREKNRLARARRKEADPIGFAAKMAVQRAKRLSTESGLLNSRMGRLMYCSLRSRGGKGGRRWTELAGYSIELLIKRLKSTMPHGWTWDDYLAGRLHVDHIVPIAAFSYDSADHVDFRRCWALSNLRLLPARENMVKSAKLLAPFQPSLL